MYINPKKIVDVRGLRRVRTVDRREVANLRVTAYRGGRHTAVLYLL